jgi:gluconate kinase
VADKVKQLRDARLIAKGFRLKQEYRDVINALTPNEIEELISLKGHLDSLKIRTEELGEHGVAQAVVIL